MSKSATDLTYGVMQNIAGGSLEAENPQEVAEYLNWCAGQIVTCYFSLGVTAFGTGWTASTGLPVYSICALPTSGSETPLHGHIWIDADIQQLVFRCGMVVPATNEAEVTITVGGDSDVLTFTADGEQTGTLDVSTTGTGWQSWSIEFDHTVGSSSVLTPTHVSLYGATIAAVDLPGPDGG